MQIRFHCPTESCVAIIEYEPLEGSGPTMECPRCHKSHPIKVSDSVRDRGVVDRCAVCACEEFFLRKDFPQVLGMGIVVVFGLAALYLFTVSVLYAWLVLASAVLIDVVVYFLTGTVTTCYNCRADYRKYTRDPGHAGFDLATSEKY